MTGTGEHPGRAGPAGCAGRARCAGCSAPLGTRRPSAAPGPPRSALPRPIPSPTPFPSLFPSPFPSRPAAPALSLHGCSRRGSRTSCSPLLTFNKSLQARGAINSSERSRLTSLRRGKSNNASAGSPFFLPASHRLERPGPW